MISEFIMFDSDSDSELEQVSSLTSSPESFDLVPKNIDYKIKLFGPECSKKGISFLRHLLQAVGVEFFQSWPKLCSWEPKC